MKRNHRLDCIIVGGGINGLLLALQLRAENLNIGLFDKGQLGQESSWAGGGILSPLYPWRYPHAVNRLAITAGQAYSQLAQKLRVSTGLDVEYIDSGMLVLEDSEIKQAQVWSEQYQVPIQQISSAKTQEPELSHEIPALLLVKAAQVRNPKLVKALKIHLINQGVDLYENTQVVDFVSKGEKVIGVQTRGGQYLAENTVLASGAWTATIASQVGLRIPVFPVKGQMLLYQCDRPLLSHICLRHGRYLIPRRDRQILVGSTLEKQGFDKACTEPAYRELRDVAIELLPNLNRHGSIRAQWAGLRPGTEQGIPIIGPCLDRPGLWLNAGQYRNGLVMAPASARLLADLMLQRVPEVDPEPYSWNAHTRLEVVE